MRQVTCYRTDPIKEVAHLLETFSSSFIDVPHGKLYYRPLERCKAKPLVLFEGNFDKMMHVSKDVIQDILKWEQKIIGAYTNFREKPDATSFG